MSSFQDLLRGSGGVGVLMGRVCILDFGVCFKEFE